MTLLSLARWVFPTEGDELKSLEEAESAVGVMNEEAADESCSLR